MFNKEKIRKNMNQFIEKQGYIVRKLENLDKIFYAGVSGIHDETTIFLEVNDATKKLYEDSFLVLTFNQVSLYQKNMRKCKMISSLLYHSLDELKEFFGEYAKVDIEYNERLFEQVVEYIDKFYPEYIKEKNEHCIELTLPYNLTSEKEQPLYIKKNVIQHYVYTGSPYTGSSKKIKECYYYDLEQFIAFMKEWYNIRTIWS